MRCIGSFLLSSSCNILWLRNLKITVTLMVMEDISVVESSSDISVAELCHTDSDSDTFIDVGVRQSAEMKNVQMTK